MSAQHEMSRADEYREIAKDCVRMGNPGLAIEFQKLALKVEREEGALAAIFGTHVSPSDSQKKERT